MSTENQPEDKAILAALEQLSAPDGAVPEGMLADDVPAELVREHTELLGLLPYALEPEAPRPEVKAALMARLGEASAPVAEKPVDEMTLRMATQPASAQPASAQPMATHEERAFDDVTLHQGKARVGAQGTDIRNVVAPSRYSARRSNRAAMALAAVLAVCLVGMGYLYGQNQQQSQEISELVAHLDSVRQDNETAVANVDRLSRELTMVTTIARQVYPLRPAKTSNNLTSNNDKSSALVFVCGQHQKWLLSVRNADRASVGEEYHLWFKTPDGMKHAGIVQLEDGAGTLEAPQMPVGTQGFILTLEEGESTPPEPGRTVLVSNESYAL